MGYEIRPDLIFRYIPNGIPHNRNHQSIHPHLNELQRCVYQHLLQRNVLAQMWYLFFRVFETAITVKKCTKTVSSTLNVLCILQFLNKIKCACKDTLLALVTTTQILYLVICKSIQSQEIAQSCFRSKDDLYEKLHPFYHLYKCNIPKPISF